MVELAFRAVDAAIGKRIVLSGINLSIGAGGIVALLGCNGAGKSTLLRTALGLTAPASGAVLLGGRDPRSIPPTARARLCAYLPQARPLAWPLKVADVVALGRFAYGASPGRLAGADAAAVARALGACDLERLADRACDALSGGELARVHIARALAAEAPLILADEPTAALDPLHAWRVMGVMARFVAAGGSVLASLHDVTLAARFAARVIVLADGGVIADGPPLDVLTSDVLARAYGVAAAIEASAHGPVLSVGGPR